MMWTTRPRSERGTLSAIISGSGPRVLLIHGVGLCADAWAAQIDALAHDFTVHAIDLPGHGDSALPARDLTLADYTDLVAATLNGPALVIGHSMGAMIALDMAIRYPDRVRAVVGLNAIHLRSATARVAVRARAASLDGVAVADPSGTLDRWFAGRASPERDACRTWLGAADPAGYAMAYRVFTDQDGPSNGDLSQLACPALFLTGSAEPNSTPAMSQRMAALAPQGRATIIEGAAHMMPMTHADQVNAALLAFARESA